jgi:transposase
MANQLKMADAQAILALVGHGWSYRRIGRELGVDRATVRRYVRLAAGKGSNPANALTGSGDLISQIFRALQRIKMRESKSVRPKICPKTIRHDLE